MGHFVGHVRKRDGGSEKDGCWTHMWRIVGLRAVEFLNWTHPAQGGTRGSFVFFSD